SQPTLNNRLCVTRSPTYRLDEQRNHVFSFTTRPPPISTLFPYTTLFRSIWFLTRRQEVLHDGMVFCLVRRSARAHAAEMVIGWRSEEHTSELQSRRELVCRLLLEKKKH